jgi:hypothetical protein
MLIFILISVYILSIIGCKYIHLLEFNKFSNNFYNKNPKISFSWFIPIANTLAIIIILIFSLFYLKKLIKPTKNKFINWLCNFHLIKDR